MALERGEMTRFRQERLAEIRSQREAGRKVIGYLCLYAPVELIQASGAIPVRLSLGGHEAEIAGTKYLRSDACTFCKSCLGNFENDPLYALVDAVVVANTCDMMRRLPESIMRHFRKPVLEVYVPRTAEALPHRLSEFRRQLELLRGGLGGITGQMAEDDGLRAAVASYNSIRQGLRAIDELRLADAPRVSESRMLALAALAWLLSPEQAGLVLSEAGPAASDPGEAAGRRRPRLMFGGSMLAEDDLWLVELIERRADIVVDVLCTGGRSFAEDVPETEDPLDGLTRFYYGRIPCMHRRPNDAFYDYARRLARERRVDGFVYKTLLYCDAYSFEAKRLKQALGLPMLHLDTDYSYENREQVRTRVEAFLEML
jgi:benzoyl-CoA reductase/2-hydroxyglutaryl-CoA dehydratase subunit BcrC/BadD/HgdB